MSEPMMVTTIVMTGMTIAAKGVARVVENEKAIERIPG